MQRKTGIAVRGASTRAGVGQSWRKVLRNAILMSSLLLPTGCNKSETPKVEEKAAASKHGLTPEQAKQPLVVIGDTTITVGDFADQLADKSPYLRARYTSPERRRELLDELVKFELLAREASRRGLDSTDE